MGLGESKTEFWLVLSRTSFGGHTCTLSEIKDCVYTSYYANKAWLWLRQNLITATLVSLGIHWSDSRLSPEPFYLLAELIDLRR